jgi:hypothetical protein
MICKNLLVHGFQKREICNFMVIIFSHNLKEGIHFDENNYLLKTIDTREKVI